MHKSKKILNLLEQIWELNPDFRLGQILVNALPTMGFFYIEDEYVIENLEKFLNKLKKQKNKNL